MPNDAGAGGAGAPDPGRDRTHRRDPSARQPHRSHRWRCRRGVGAGPRPSGVRRSPKPPASEDPWLLRAKLVRTGKGWRFRYFGPVLYSKVVAQELLSSRLSVVSS